MAKTKRPMNIVDDGEEMDDMPLMHTYGDSGTKRYSGYFMEEPNAEWRDEKRVENVETMRRTDGTVKQLLLAVKAPILSQEPTIEAGSDSPEHQKHKEFIEQNLAGLDTSWNDFMRQALTTLDFGHSAFETLYKIKDGQIWWKDFAPRIQSSILKWEINQLDALGKPRKGITQQIESDNLDKSQTEIPMEKLVIFTNEKEGDDLTGQSILRPAWKHFYIKDNLYKISAISCERFGVGVPVITIPEGAGKEEKKKAAQWARNLKSNEKAYIVKPEGWEFEIMTPSGNPQQGQIDQLIQHHDRMILCAGLAGFLNLGSNGGGSYALSADQSPFFVKFVEGIARYMAEQFTEQAIYRLIVLNFGEQEAYPKMTYGSMAETDLPELANALQSLINADLIKKDGRLTQFVHKTYRLPAITQDMLDEMEMDELEKEMDSLDLPVEEDEPVEEEPVDVFPEEEEEEEGIDAI